MANNWVKVCVLGSGHLAEATRRECVPHFNVVEFPSSADLVWIAHDMPVTEFDEPIPAWLMDRLGDLLPGVRPGVPILISTQVPVGFTAKAEAEWPEHHFAVQPENIRRATAQADFHFQARIVVGTRHEEDHELIRSVVSKFCPRPDRILFMSPESAEMSKHVLNAFLATEISFANEMASLCGYVGADVTDVFTAFRTDRRVGNGPLEPGAPYRGGTLGRDVRVLVELGAGPLIEAVDECNRARL